MKKIILLIITLGLVFTEMFAAIEMPSTQGSQFVFGFMRTDNNKTVKLSLTVSSPYKGILKIYNANGVLVASPAIAKGITILPLAEGKANADGLSALTSYGALNSCYTNTWNAVQQQGYYLEAFYDGDDASTTQVVEDINTPLKVSLYAGLDCSSSSDAANVYPVDALGNEYYVISRPANQGNKRDTPSEFLVVAAEDNTTIDIYPTALIKGQSASDDVSQKITRTLNRGETYLITALNDNITAKGENDLTGTRIVGANGSCKKFAVFSGSAYGSGINTAYNNGDYEYDQLFPTHLWGTDYITGSTGKYDGQGRDEIRVVASKPCTEVYINKTYVATLNQGDFYSYIDTEAAGTYVHTSKPVEVGLLPTGQNVGSSADGGPSLIVLAPMQQYLRSIDFSVFKAQDVSGNSVMITALTTIRDKTHLITDGVTDQLLDNSYGWQTITSNPLYSQLIIPVSTTSSYRLLNDAPADSLGGFTAIVYGSAGKNSGYGYSVGASASVIKTSFNLNGSAALNSANLNKDICVSQSVDFVPIFPDGVTVGSVDFDFDGDGVNDTTTYGPTYVASKAYKNTGTYTVRMIVHKIETSCFSAAASDTVYATFSIKKTVNLTVKKDTICKTDTYNAPLDATLSTLPVSDIGFKWVTSRINGKDSTLYSVTTVDALPINLDYGQSRKYWRRTWVTGDNCTEYVDTFYIKIKDVVTSPIVDKGLVCKGTVLSSTRTPSSETDFTGKMVSYQWYNATTNTPISGATSIDYTITDDYGATAKYYVESSAGCKFVDTIKIEIPTKITNLLTPSATKVCGDGATQVTVTATQTGAVTSSSWTMSSNGGAYNALTPSVSALVHQYTATDSRAFKFTSTGLCETLVADASVEANPSFTASLAATSAEFIAPEMLPVSGGKVTLDVTTDVSGIYSYKWTPSRITDVASYEDNVTTETTYMVVVTDADGLCKSTTNSITIRLGEVELHTILVPTSSNILNSTFAEFDETNRPLYPNTFSYGYKTTIFNRYGQVISEKGNGGWDGKYKGAIADAGVYYYVVEYKTSNGSRQLKGSIEIIK